VDWGAVAGVRRSGRCVHHAHHFRRMRQIPEGVRQFVKTGGRRYWSCGWRLLAFAGRDRVWDAVPRRTVDTAAVADERLENGGGELMLNLGEVGGMIEGEDFGGVVIVTEGGGKGVGRGLVLHDVVPGRHGQRWMRPWIPRDFLVRRRHRCRRRQAEANPHVGGSEEDGRRWRRGWFESGREVNIFRTNITGRKRERRFNQFS